jgi:uncharacterized membrane protein YccC
MNTKPYWKALGGAVVAGASAAGVAQADGISGGEWWTIAGAFLAGGIATFYIPYQSTVQPPK